MKLNPRRNVAYKRAILPAFIKFIHRDIEKNSFFLVWIGKSGKVWL